MKNTRWLVAISVVLFSYTLCLDAQEWSQWRGPYQTGAAVDGSFALGADNGFAIVWQKDLGSGYSSISIDQGRAVTMFSDGEADYLITLDADTGEELWRYRIDDTYVGHDASHDGTLSTPAVSDGVVYGVGPKGQIFALKLADGSKVWEASLVDLGSAEPFYGWTTSPMIVGEMLILQTGGKRDEEGEERSPEALVKAVTGFDKRNGKVLWTVGDDAINYQSPVLVEVFGQMQVVCAGDQSIFGLDPKTGKELWQLKHEGGDEAANPIPAGDNRFFIRHARRRGMLLEVLREGSGFAAREVWVSTDLKNTDSPTTYRDGYLYGMSGPFLTCVDAKTGERKWRSREPGDGFPMILNDHLIIMTKQGSLHAAKASPAGYEEVANIDLFDHLGWTPPSFAEGKIYVRSLEKIACIGPGKAEQAAQVERPIDAGKLIDSKFATFVNQVEAADQGERAAMIDQFLAEHDTFPIIEDDRMVHVVFRDQVEDIAIGGDLLEAGQNLPLNQVEGTDLYYYSFELDSDAFISYGLQKNFEEQITDPLNPRIVTGFAGEQSALSMPGWSDSGHLDEYPLETIEHTSTILENTRQLQVYLPPFYTTSDQRYPVLYVHYGRFAVDNGLLVRSLNNLIGRSVQPIVAVFIGLAEGGGFGEISGENKDQYARMVVEEIVPLIDGKYRTVAESDSRATMGASAAGFMSVYLAFNHPGVFGWAVGQSANFDQQLGDEMKEILAAANDRVPTRFFLHWGTYDFRLEAQDIDRIGVNRELVKQLEEKGYKVVGREMPHGYGYGSWSTVNDDILETMFPLT
ncbi:MAG: PQQ-binding-like beta-propeller repeat protein [bacterium]|nr:PQQ-binding-like beta-propeller repeat protein [bacterium]